MPDFFKGPAADPSWVPPDTDEKKAAMAEFRGRATDFDKARETLKSVMGKLRDDYAHVTEWAAIGYCWGGKVVPQASGEGTPFVVGVLTSPARLDAEEAGKIVIPTLVLASKGEPVDEVKAFGEALKVEKRVETFGDQVHGWMSARADLKDARVKEEYERGYKITLDFLDEHFAKAS